MASIQQSMNQMLATVGAMSGLFVHSPQGKELARHFKRKRIETEKAKTQDPEAIKLLEKEGREVTMESFKANPTAKTAEAVVRQRPDPKKQGPMKESIGSWSPAAQGFGSAGKGKESKAIRSLYERAETKQEQKQNLENRFEIVAGGYDNSVWEEYTNGK